MAWSNHSLSPSLGTLWPDLKLDSAGMEEKRFVVANSQYMPQMPCQRFRNLFWRQWYVFKIYKQKEIGHHLLF